MYHSEREAFSPQIACPPIDPGPGPHTLSVPLSTQKADRLTELGFNVIPHQPCTDAHEAVAYFHEIARTRDLLPFWIDGVVMKIDDIAKQTALGIEDRTYKLRFTGGCGRRQSRITVLLSRRWRAERARSRTDPAFLAFDGARR